MKRLLLILLLVLLARPALASLWADPAGMIPSSGSVVNAQVVQPALSGDIIGLAVQNVGASALSPQYVSVGQAFRDGDVHVSHFKGSITSNTLAISAFECVGNGVSSCGTPAIGQILYIPGNNTEVTVTSGSGTSWGLSTAPNEPGGTDMWTTPSIVARIGGTNYYAQFDPLSTWPDGSLRHGVFTFNTNTTIAGGSFATPTNLPVMIAVGAHTGSAAPPGTPAPTASALVAGSYDTTVNITPYIPGPVPTISYLGAGVINTTGGSLTPSSQVYVGGTCTNGSGETGPLREHYVANSLGVMRRDQLQFAASGNNQSISLTNPCPGGSTFKVYACSGSCQGSETFQGSTTGSPYVLGAVTTGGASPPSSNTAALSATSISGKTTLSGALSSTTTIAHCGSYVCYWLSGPAVMQYDVVGSVNAGNTLKVEFDIAAYAGGASLTDVTFDSGWLQSSGKTGVQYTVTTTQDSYSSSQQQWLYTAWDHVVAQGMVDDYALPPGGSAPGTLNIVYDYPYLIAAGVVPQYDVSQGAQLNNNFGLQALGVLGDSNHRYIGLTTNTSLTNPMSQGLLDTQMNDPGNRDEIGIQPAWVPVWLVSQDIRGRYTMFVNGRAGGTIPVRYIDETTGNIINIQNNPSFYNGQGYNTVTPTGASFTGNAGPAPGSGMGDSCADQGWAPNLGKNPAQACDVNGFSPSGDFWFLETNHSPDTTYMPWIITGRRFYLSVFESYVTWMLSASGAGDYSGGLAFTGGFPAFGCIPNSNCSLSNGVQPRGVAWMLRDAAEAGAAVPDADSLKTSFLHLFWDNTGPIPSGNSKGMHTLHAFYVTSDVNSYFGQIKGGNGYSNGPNINNYNGFEWAGYFLSAIEAAVRLNPLGGVPLAESLNMLTYTNNVNFGMIMEEVGSDPFVYEGYWRGIINVRRQSTNYADFSVANWGDAREEGACGHFDSGPYETLGCASNTLYQIICSTWNANGPNFGGSNLLPVPGCNTGGIMAAFLTNIQLPYPLTANTGLGGAVTHGIEVPDSLRIISFNRVWNEYGWQLNFGGQPVNTGFQGEKEMDIVAVLPDGRQLQDADFNPVLSCPSTCTLAPLRSGMDSLLAVAHPGSTTGTATFNGGSGAVEIYYGGWGNNVFNMGSGNDYAFVDNRAIGLSTFVDGAGTNYYWGGNNAAATNKYEFETASVAAKIIGNFNPATDTLVIKQNLNGNGLSTAAAVLAAAVNVATSTVATSPTNPQGCHDFGGNSAQLRLGSSPGVGMTVTLCNIPLSQVPSPTMVP